MKSLLIPGHETSVVNKRGVVTATCTCGWGQVVKDEILAEQAAENLCGQHLASMAPKRTGFRAVCKRGAWLDLAVVLASDPLPEGAFPERWNRKLERNEMLIPCDFETDDRAVFEQHMKDLHGDRPPQWDSPDLDPAAAGRHIKTYRPRKFPVKPWKRPADRPFDAKSWRHEVEVETVDEPTAQAS